MSILPPHQLVPSVTVAAGSPNLVANNINLTAAPLMLKPGDWIMSGGSYGIIQSMAYAAPNTNVVLEEGFPIARAGVAARIYRVDDSSRQLQAQVDFLTALSSNMVTALKALMPAANKLPYLDAASMGALADLTPFARTLLDDANGAAVYATLGQIPNAQVRSDLTPDKAFRRGNILGTVSQSGGVPTGEIIQRGSNANGEFVRLADGTQICMANVATDYAVTTAIGSMFVGGTGALTFPAAFAATPFVSRYVHRQGGGGSAFVAPAADNDVTTAGVRIAAYSPVSLPAVRFGYVATGKWFV